MNIIFMSFFNVWYVDVSITFPRSENFIIKNTFLIPIFVVRIYLNNFVPLPWRTDLLSIGEY